MSVADLLVPNPYPLSLGPISTSSLVVTGNATVGGSLSAANLSASVATTTAGLNVSGAAVNAGANLALALISPSATVVAMPLASSGVFASVWTSTAGFPVGPTVTNIIWSRTGNVVTCFGVFYNVTDAAGINNATITLPVARTVNFAGLPEELCGTSFKNGLGTIFAVPATTDTASITITAVGGASSPVNVAFSYRLTP